MSKPLDAPMSRHKTAALELIDQQSTMTLATSANNRAWAAPVYYVRQKAAFYFFSKPESQHVQEALANDSVAAAIYPYAETWQGIRGIQMSGQVSPVRPGFRALQAVRAYIGKFPFTSDFFEDGQVLDLVGFSKRFRVKLYCFTPQCVYYLDNSVQFGFRSEIDLYSMAQPEHRE
ncbi:hypothetical protein DSCO28_49180 [Desulfosarcina ovata subsp. sediminis]|uniref:Pyridoxamine 5'-phosphate oxidase N-terminal domain-containing protein n=1 Tax=Desulfosarcina ovata subsp. sediminis TaxID=885957 RepID=A0A5K7ZVS0_9BACT|nr:pyridoxamine 5'-phosphate oxidase family protein [Desulfosarcina ovata]BBO84352.1 hypothetical protein DSCO28_49180 [Desulfosarcina ovata subsp. sediminis]